MGVAVGVAVGVGVAVRVAVGVAVGVGATKMGTLSRAHAFVHSVMEIAKSQSVFRFKCDSW